MSRFDPPLLARIETYWRKPWLISGMAQVGPRHYDNGEAIEDAHVIGAAHGHTWLILADGVGASPMSHEGSRAATSAVAQYFAERLGPDSKPDAALMTAAFQAAHDSLAGTAKASKRPISDYGSTLIAAVLTGDSIVAGNIGDSGIAAYSTHLKGDQTKPRLTPFASSEQTPRAGTTYGITHLEWRKHVTVRESSSPHIKALVLATDGANGFYLDEAPDPHVFDTTFLDAIDNAVKKLTPRAYCNFFATYLIQEEPDNFDDRTLIVAYRLDSKLQPPDAQR